ncbi:MAG: hypothetical protein AAF480_03040 [Actinomycetota bacterium]
MARVADGHNRWDLGAAVVERIAYFDTPLPAETIDLVGAVEDLAWSDPWQSDGQPAVGQAFWIVTVGDRSIVVDPCGASDDFLRTGPDAVGHQDAAFAAFEAAGHDPEAVEQVVLTHLDGIGMTALADGGAAGEERWRPAFPNATVVVSRAELAHIAANPEQCPGAAAFGQLDDAGIVRGVEVPAEVLPGVSLEWTGGHGPGHCVVRARGTDREAVLIGHLAVSPLHAGRPASGPHLDQAGAWKSLAAILERSAGIDALVAGALWPAPGSATVEVTPDGYVLTPA